MSKKIFLLTALKRNLKFPKKIIVWADNEKDAREYGPVDPPEKIKIGQETPIQEYGPFVSSKSSTCTELKEGSDYKVLNKNDEAIEIRLTGTAEDLIFKNDCPSRWRKIEGWDSN